jgi:effector-binding domain-containing protein
MDCPTSTPPFSNWIGESVYEVDGPFREIDHDPCSPEVTVEVQYPVRVCR